MPDQGMQSRAGHASRCLQGFNEAEQHGQSSPEQVLCDIPHVDIEGDHGHQGSAFQGGQPTASCPGQLSQLQLYVVQAMGQIELGLLLCQRCLNCLAPHDLVDC